MLWYLLYYPKTACSDPKTACSGIFFNTQKLHALVYTFLVAPYLCNSRYQGFGATAFQAALYVVSPPKER